MLQLGCQGSEESFHECPQVVSPPGCGHHEDTGVECYNINDTGMCCRFKFDPVLACMFLPDYLFYTTLSI